MRDASLDIRYIRHFGKRFSATIPTSGYISGLISNREADLNGFTKPTWPVPGVYVKAQGEKGIVVKSVTGLDGRYEFFDLPPDKYQLSVSGRGRCEPTGTSIVNVEPNSCSSVYFLRANRAVLRGWLVESDGEPDSSSDLVLVPIDEHPQSPRPGNANELQADPEEDGTFRFEVPPGRYRPPIGEDAVLEYPRVLVLDERRESSVTFRLPARAMQRIEGLAVDGEDRPVEGVTVRISGNGPRGSDFFGKTVASDHGEFSFEVIPLKYELWTEAKTCAGFTGRRVTVNKGQTEPVTLPMPAAYDQPCSAPR